MNNTDFDLDLDVISFEKTMGKDESIIYVRNWDDNVSFVVHGNVPDLTNAILDVKQLRMPILMAAAYLVKKEKEDIDKYVEMII